MADVLKEYTTKDGTLIRLLHADSSDGSGMRHGTCPGCKNGMEGFVGISAAMCELDSDMSPVYPSKLVSSTNWGHGACVTRMFNKLIENIESNVDIVLPWIEGTQREMVLFLHEVGAIEVTYDRARPSDRRYHYRQGPA